MITLKDVVKIYQSKKGTPTMALNGINLTIEDKGMVFIVGKSGSGKSTLLNVIGGLDSITSGTIAIDGNAIENFREKEFDCYRNTYVGFVFQEFNVLEEYNVYDNIALALHLQDKKVEKKQIQELLKQLGLDNLELRHMNELSGGQKQRVAIARAIIKNPTLLLADEPTGNLDQNSSRQIFEILKEISKNQLVLVVSHNKEAANIYADRIIEIEDGKVVQDTKPITESTHKRFALRKSHLPFFYAFRMALTSLKEKPLKLFMTIFLTMMSLIFTAFALNCAWFDEKALEFETMKKNENHVYSLFQATVTYNASGNYSAQIEPLTEEDFSTLENLSGKKVNPVYQIADTGESLTFTYGEKEPVPYLEAPLSLSFVEMQTDQIVGEILGRLPEKKDEIVIHPYLADYMGYYGVLTLEGEFYYPKSREDLIKDNRKILLGNNPVTVVGILKSKEDIYEKMKKEGETADEELLQQYADYLSKAGYIYGKGFTEQLTSKKEEASILKQIEIGILFHTISPTKFLKEEVEVFSFDGKGKVSTLQENEIILSLADFKSYYSTWDEEFAEYLKLHKNEIYKDALEEFLVQFIKEKNALEAVKMQLKNRLTNRSIDAKIVGVSLEKDTYISTAFLNGYTIQKSVEEVLVYEEDWNHLKGMISKTPMLETVNKEGKYYAFSIDHGLSIAMIVRSYKILKLYILLLSLIFLLFSFLLFSNFLGTSISYRKKEIGILRALGATSTDVIKIFIYESLCIGFLAWVLAMGSWTFLCYFLNESWFGNLYYTLNGILINPWTFLAILGYISVIAICITILLVGKITYIKPMDAILER